MIVHVFSALDVLVALLIILTQYVAVSWVVLLYAATYLLFKAVVFHTTWVSWVDGVVGLFVLLLVAGFSSWFAWLAAAWLVFKALFGFISW